MSVARCNMTREQSDVMVSASNIHKAVSSMDYIESLKTTIRVYARLTRFRTESLCHTAFVVRNLRAFTPFSPLISQILNHGR